MNEPRLGIVYPQFGSDTIENRDTRKRSGKQFLK